MHNDNDIITAISTPIGQSAIGIIRVTGNGAIEIVDSIFKPNKETSLLNSNSHTIHYGQIKDSKNFIDEVLVSVLRAPNTYTKQDTVEISTHGNTLILQKVLDLLIKKGARLAAAGEFTKRAFLNGRLDLTQAEAVMDILSAKTQQALSASIKNLQGYFKEQVEILEENIKNILMFTELEIDFSDQEIDKTEGAVYKEKINQIIDKMNELLSSYNRSLLLRNGVSIVLTGAPNTGKSSLLNAILKQEKAIVTDIPGTTRDSLEHFIDLEGIPCYLIDTAGLRDAENIIEAKGIEKTKKNIVDAHIIVFLVDCSRRFMIEELKFFEEINKKNENVIVCINKIDVFNKESLSQIEENFSKNPLVKISAKNGQNINALEKKIIEMVNYGKVEIKSSFMINARHKQIFENIKEALVKINKEDIFSSNELLSFELKEVLSLLGQITGKSYSEDILDMIFGNFCIGK